MKALIFQNKVVDISEQEFEVSPEMQWVDAPENCQIGWVFENEQLIAPAFNETQTYAEKRMAAYPSFADQFDMLYHGGYDAWKSAIDAVKQKYPKPE